MAIPEPTPIYHITHLRHLTLIIERGGLHSKSFISRAGWDYTNIAHSNIQDQRATTWVPCGRQGVLLDYVPFYFAPRSPMLCAIWHGRVAGYTEGQPPIIHLVSTAQAVKLDGHPFVFTDGHGIMVFTDFFDDLSNLNAIDWEIMRARYWADTATDNDRSRRRQAEFLIHEFCPWTLITEIGVMTAQMRQQVEEILSQADHKPLVTVRRGWYY